MIDKIGNHDLVPTERIAGKIFLFRGENVILDVHIAEFYNIETRVLKQAVRRNKDRFPGLYMFELTEEEIETVIKRKIIPSKQKLGGANPFAFTELGVSMLSSVLKSKEAIKINMAIMETFVFLRRLLSEKSDLLIKLEKIEEKLADHDNSILVLFEYLKQFEQAKQQELGKKSRRRIGFKLKGEKEE